jgi:hypothetical protein
MNSLRKIALAGMLVLATCFLTVSPSQSLTIYDNFNDNILNTDIWAEVLIHGIGPFGPSFSETNQRLEITIPATSTPDDNGFGVTTGPAPFYDAMDQQPLDFDVQVDLNLLAWPAANGIGAGMQLFGEGLPQCTLCGGRTG